MPKSPSSSPRRSPILFPAWIAVIFCLSAPVWSGDFAVSPIRMDLDRSAKTGAVTVSNDADTSLQLQVKLSAWTQDAEGKDVYEESNDLTWFPRMITLPPKEQQLVRAGLRLPAAEQEKSYRLFIEEIPEPAKVDEKRGAAVAVAIRFGVPIFVKPVQEAPKGEIERIEVVGGDLRVRIRNTGNVHFVVQSLAATSGNFSKSIEGWYLLPGAVRTHTIPVGTEACRGLGRVRIAITTDRMELAGEAEVDKAGCK